MEKEGLIIKILILLYWKAGKFLINYIDGASNMKY